VGEEARRITRGAAIDYADVFLRNSGILQLTHVRLDQVEMNFGADFAMPRSLLVEKQERISHVQHVRVKHFLEEFVGVAELRLELCADLGANLITTFPNRGSNGGVEATRFRGRLPNRRCISPMPFSTTRATVPRQPA
jgi:hypothetical protein